MCHFKMASTHIPHTQSECNCATTTTITYTVHATFDGVIKLAYVNKILPDCALVVWFCPECVLELHGAHDFLLIAHACARTDELLENATERVRVKTVAQSKTDNAARRVLGEERTLVPADTCNDGDRQDIVLVTFVLANFAGFCGQHVSVDDRTERTPHHSILKTESEQINLRHILSP